MQINKFASIAYKNVPIAFYLSIETNEEICMDKNAIEKVMNCLETCGYSYVTGKTWTTDAICRETKSLIEERKAAGCIAKAVG